MCELARALVNHGWSMNIATFSTQDLREQGHKSYTITSDKSHSSFVTIDKKVSESIVVSSYEQNVM